MCAVKKLHGSYARRAYLAGMRLEFLPHHLGPVFDGGDQNIRIQHVTQHQSARRSCSAGCSRSCMKSLLTPSPSNHAAQPCSVGVRIQLRPWRWISTLVTPSGRRTDFGNRTACVLFVMNTDPRSIAPTSRTISLVYTLSTHIGHRQAAHLGAMLSNHTTLCGPPTPLSAAKPDDMNHAASPRDQPH